MHHDAIELVEPVLFRIESETMRLTAAAFFRAGLKTSLLKSTAMIGAAEAAVKIPKPSSARVAFLKPIPRESTKGTVTGPVVTPALSQAMLVKSSGVKKVKTRDMKYLTKIRYTRGMLKRIFVDPITIPVPTPMLTEYISIDLEK